MCSKAADRIRLLCIAVLCTVSVKAATPEVLKNNALPEPSYTGDCETSLVAGTNFSSFGVSGEYSNSIDQIDYIEGDVSAIEMSSKFRYSYRNGNFHKWSLGRGWDYAILSNPAVLNDDYTPKNDGVNRLIVAPANDYPWGPSTELFTYTVTNLKLGSDVRLTFDVERVNRGCSGGINWQYRISAVSGSQEFDAQEYSIYNKSTQEFFFRNVRTSELVITFGMTTSAACEAVAFSDIKIYACQDMSIKTDAGGNNLCEGSVLTLTASGLERFSGAYKWEKRTSADGAWTVIQGANGVSIQASLDLGPNYFRVTRGEGSAEIELLGTVCCSADDRRSVVFYEDFGTATGRVKNDIVEKIGVYTFAASGKVTDNLYCVVSNINQADPTSCGWPRDKTDHTGNANGAFLLVNAGDRKTMFYEADLGDQFCDDAYYTMSLWAANVATSEYAPAEFMFEVVDKGTNEVLNQWYTGSIEGFNEEGVPFNWNRYGFTFYPRQDAHLLLRIYSTSAEINGNDFALDDIMVTSCVPDVTLYGDYDNMAIDAEVECGADHVLKAVSSGKIETIFPTPYYLWQSSADGGATWRNAVGAYSKADLEIVPRQNAPLSYRVIVAQNEDVANRVASGGVLGNCDIYVISNTAAITCKGCEKPENLKITSSVDEVCKGAAATVTLTASVSYGVISSYAWSRYDAASSTWVDVETHQSSALSDVLTVKGPFEENVRYRVVCSSDTCTSEAEYELTVLDIPDVDFVAEAEKVTCSGWVELTALTSAADVTYNWYKVKDEVEELVAGGTLNNDILVMEAGTFSVEVVSSKTGCSNKDAVTLGIDTISPKFSITPSAEKFTCDVTEMTLTAETTDTNLSYQWYKVQNDVAEVISNEVSKDLKITSPGTYSVNVKSLRNSCDNEKVITIGIDTITTKFSISKSAEKFTCDVNEIILTAETSDTDISYQWYKVQGKTSELIANEVNSELTINAPGTYSVELTSSKNGCSNKNEITVELDTVAPKFSISKSADQFTCDVTEIVLTASTSDTDISYQWYKVQNGASEVIANEVNSELTIKEAGTYSVSLTSLKNGCSKRDEITVEIDTITPNFSISKSQDKFTCDVTEIVLTASTSDTDISYQWYKVQNETSEVIANEVNNELTINSPGTYSVELTSSKNGCSNKDEITVGIDTITPKFSISKSAEKFTCDVNEIILTAETTDTDISYQWYKVQNGTSEVIANEVNNELAINAPGTYSVELTSLKNGCSNKDEITVGIDTITPKFSISKSQDKFTCDVTEIVLTASTSDTDISYQWYKVQNETSEVIANEVNNELTIKEAGTYSVSLTSLKNGCSNKDEITVEIDTITPKFSISKSQDKFTCDVNEIILTAETSATDISYQWYKVQNGTSEVIAGEVGRDLKITAAGTYLVNVKSLVNGCDNEEVITVELDTVAPKFSISKSAEKFTCDVTEITLDAETTDTDVSYQWYKIQNETSEVIANEVGNELTINAPGIYSVSLTSLKNGCNNKDEITVEIDTITPKFSIIKSQDKFTCDVNEIILTAETSATDISYQWYKVQNGVSEVIANEVNSELTIKEAGTYSVELTSLKNGCSKRDEITVEIDTITPKFSISKSQDKFTCDVTEIVLTASTSDTDISYQWYKIQNETSEVIVNEVSNELTINTPGTYSVELTSSKNGCSNKDEITVGVDTVAPIFSISKSQDKFTCDVTEIVLTASTSATDVSYQWYKVQDDVAEIIGGEVGKDIKITSHGTYSVNVKSAVNGCDNEEVITVELDTVAPKFSISKSADQFTCDVTEIVLTASTSATDVSYQWYKVQDGTSEVVAGEGNGELIITEAGTYSVSLTSLKNGCGNKDEITIGVDTVAPVVRVMVDAEVLSCGDDEVVLTATAGEGLLYDWEGRDDDNSLIVTEKGTYYLTVRDGDNGCETVVAHSVGDVRDYPSLEAEDELSACLPEVVDLGAAVRADAAADVRYYYDSSLTNELETTQLSSPTSAYYYVSATSENGCRSIDSVYVRINELAASIMPDGEFCDGDMIELWVRGEGLQKDGYDYEISYAGKELEGSYDNGIFTAADILDVSKTYDVKVENGACSMKGRISVRTIALPSIRIDVTDGAVEIVQASFGREPYLYSLDGAEAVEETVFEAVGSGTHTIEVSDAGGCVSIYEFEAGWDRPELFIPKFFSPNADGYRDLWAIENIEYYAPLTIEIYDRYGKKLISYDDKHEGWDGFYNGHPMPMDDYWYIVRGPEVGTLSGHFTLKR